MKSRQIYCFALFIAMIQFISECEALRCYSCSVTSSTSDLRCLSDPVSVEGQSVVNCNKKYCTIFRQELRDPFKINSFTRGCEEVPIFINEVIEDPTFKTYYRTCSTDLCNAGDGLQSSTNVRFSPDGYEGENLLVPGLPFNSSAQLAINMITFYACVTLYWLIN